MKVIPNNVLPFPGFAAINLFGLVFVRRDYWDTALPWLREQTLRHESIHTAQGRELLWVGFYLAYFCEWLVRLVVNGPRRAYVNISFEREAYAHAPEEGYLETRKHFAQWRKS